MIFPFLNNDRCDGEDFSSPSILDVFRWMMYQTPNEKYFVGNPQDVFYRIIENTNGDFLPNGTIIINKHIFKAVRKYNKIIKNGKLNYSRYFKYAGIIKIEDRTYNIFFTKKVIKANMAFYFSDQNPFSIWKDDEKLKTTFHVKKLNQGILKKCQIKIWP